MKFLLFATSFFYFLTAHSKNGALFVYDFGLQDKSVNERVKLLDSLGFSGVVFNVKTWDQLVLIDRYDDVIKEYPDFKILAVYHPFNFSSENEVWKAIVTKLSGKDIIFWPILLGTPKRENAIKKVREMALFCDSLKVGMVLYPHDRSYIETAEESLQLINEATLTNCKTSFHLCHELRAGNKNRLAEAATNVATYLAIATVSGAKDLVEYDGQNGWGDTILPLQQGNFNITVFLNALIKAGFKGDIVLHTFGINDEPLQHLAESIQFWKRLNPE